MFDWIPLPLYTPFYYYLLLLVVLIVIVDTRKYSIPSGNKFKYLGIFILIFIIAYIGLRPINGYYFGDTGTYAYIFRKYANGGELTTSQDIVFYGLMKISSSVINVHLFFLICALLYILPIYYVCKKWFRKFWFFGFIFFITTFSFWAYGVNGVRNGIAGSLFLYGLSRDKKVYRIIWIALAIGFHKSMLLPAGSLILASFFNQPKKIIFFWLLSIPLSLIGGGFFENLFGSLGFDDRLSYLTAGNINNDDFSSTGFRWDFVLYSATAVYAGWYYIVKKGYNDVVYSWLFNIYVLSNSFWILIIRANFSNRFAYISWFMISFILIYPLLRQTIFLNQYRKIGLILLAQFAFTFYMNVIL